MTKIGKRGGFGLLGVFVGAVVIVLGAACGGSEVTPSAKVCTPGQSLPCTGVGGCSGGQACKSDGSGYDACACGSPPPGDASVVDSKAPDGTVPDASTPDTSVPDAAPACSYGTFAAKVDYATGSGPQSIAVGDFNGDQSLDIAVTNNGSTTVSVLLANGNGGFAAKVDYATGSNPWTVAVGDFNGDNKADLTVTNWNSNTVSVLLGNGNGTFAAKVDYATGIKPDGVAVGDFNGDTKLDLAVTNNSSTTVSVLLGNGNGTFAAKVD